MWFECKNVRFFNLSLFQRVRMSHDCSASLFEDVRKIVSRNNYVQKNLKDQPHI